MYLLKRSSIDEGLTMYKDSHSTMYLLKRDDGTLRRTVKAFTFHHVSIKTLLKQ